MNTYSSSEYSRPTLFQRRSRAAQGVLALCGFMAGALILGGVLRQSAVAPLQPPPASVVPAAMTPPPEAVAQPATPPVAVSHNVQAEEALALRYFNAGDVQPDGNKFELGAYLEHDIHQAKSSEVKQIMVQSKGGSVIVLHNPDPDIVVLAGKRVLARNTARAREYAQQLSYTMKQDGERVIVRLTNPGDAPKDVFGAEAVAVVVAPSDVRVVSVSGG